jgi:hypothetical protein
MTMEKAALEERVEQLSEELRALHARVAQIESLLATPPLQHSFTAETAPQPALPPQRSPEPEKDSDDVSEEILNWAGKAHLLTRLSTLCFLLVLALILRTVTDNNLIGTLAGSVLGMVYAACLMLWGAYLYERKSPLAPVFASCGTCLMSVIVFETHARFAALPLVPAYLTLIVTGGGMTFVSYRHRAFLPISLGTLGMCLAGAAIDYPHPFFPYLAMVLFAANILGYFAAQLKSCAWLRWIVLVVTMAMLQLWGIRLGMILLRHEQPTPDLAAQWFMPSLVAFSLLYLALACAGIIRSSGEKISRFDFALPTLNALWSFSAAYYAVNAAGGSMTLLGLIGTVLAMGHLGVAVWLTGRKIEGAPGTNSFAFAGAALAAVALPALMTSYLLSLPVLCVIAFFMAILSRQWGNGGIRATTYLVQIYASLALAAALRLNPAAASDAVTALPALLLAVITLYQYQWCRRYPPPSPSVFSRFDASDRSAALLLLGALSSGFFAVKVVVLQVLTLYGDAKGMADLQRCSDSIVINASAAGIMLFAFYRGNKELRNVAILVTLIGAVKVFLYDLLGTHGFPLVASIFTFGLAAALESVALGRWHKRHAAAEEVAAGGSEGPK